MGHQTAAHPATGGECSILKVQDAPAIPILHPRRTAFVDVVAVEAAERRRGIGTAFMNTAVIWVRERGAESLEL